MIRKSVLLTLAWRWRTIAWLPQWAFVAIASTLLFNTTDALFHAAWRRATGGALPAHDDARGVSGAWFAGMALGFVLAWSTHELLRCPISATIPRLRRALAVEVSLALACASALAMLAVSRSRGEVESTAVAAIGFLGGGVGVLVANPHRFRTWATGLALVLGLFLVGELLQATWPWPRTHAAVVVPAFVALGVAAIARAYSKAEHRTYLANAARTEGVDALTLDMAYADREATSRWAPTWRGGRDWARATLHELHGGAALGWGFEAAKYAVLFGALVLVIWDEESFAMRPRPSFWFSLARNALGENTTFWRVLVTFWLVIAAMWAASVPCVPRLGFVRPASRAERARSAWSVCALRAVALLGGATALAAALAAFAAWRSAGTADPALAVRGVPDVLGAIAIVAIVAPWAAWLRLRLLDLWIGSRRFPNPLRQGAVATLAVLGCLAAGHLLGSAWYAAEEAHPALAPLLFAPAVVASWFGYRVELDRLFRTVALPV